MHNADGVPRAMVDGFERHHPHHHDKLVDTFHGKLILSTEMGDIIIKLHPDMSPESAAYVHDIAKNGCDRCAFYRAEKPGIFQGMITSSLPSPVVKGACPEDEQGAAQVCPEHDPHCACHGPVMTKGMVAWAGGGTGPDFFINMYEHPASHWGNQHTVWGRIVDEESLAIVTRVWELPVTDKGGMHYLNDNIKFTMSTDPS